MLTDLQARKVRPRDKDYKLADSAGLYLYITAKGAKSWRFKYRVSGIENRLVFGQYPEISLREARDLRDEARWQIKNGRDPAAEKRERKVAAAAAAVETFEKLARAWHALQEPRWAPVHSKDVITSLDNDVFPAIGRLPLHAIDGRVILTVLRKVEARGSIETARRLRQRISAVFAYAMSEGIADRDPAAGIVKALKPLPKKGRQPAITSLDEVRKILAAAEASTASPIVKLASRLLALTTVRPGVVRGATWDEFEGIDWDGEGPESDTRPLWRIPAARMKLSVERKDEEAFEHLVPLSTQAVDVLLAMRRLTGRNELVFPSPRSPRRPLSEGAIGYMYNSAGFQGRHVPHGWRAAFSTIMNERALTGKRPDRAIIDLMLAHLPRNTVEAVYNRAVYLDRRYEIAQEWADLICKDLADPVTSLDPEIAGGQQRERD